MKSAFRTSWLAVVAGVGMTCASYGQQSTPPPATDYTPAAPGAVNASPTVQTGIAPATSTETTPGIPTPAGGDVNRVNAAVPTESRELVAPAAVATEEFPAPDYRPALPRTTQPERRAVINTAPRPGELGVWLAERGGPGVEVRRVTEGGAADQAGVQAGDVILEINGQGASSPRGVAQMIREIPAGEIATVQIWRDGQTADLDVVLHPLGGRFEVGFRGDAGLVEMNRAGGELEMRTTRLEEQLTLVMQELKQLRAEVSQINASAPPAELGGGIDPTTSQDRLDATFPAESAPTSSLPATSSPAAVTTDLDTPAANAATGPAATPPQSAPAATPAIEAEADEAIEETAEPDADDDDLFRATGTGESADAATADTEVESAADLDTDSEAADAATDDASDDTEPAEEATEEATEEDSDDLFQ